MCANLKALPVFKNIHIYIYGQEESLQLLLIDESFVYKQFIKGEMGLWQGKVPDRSTAQSNVLEWTQSHLQGKQQLEMAGESF